MAMNCQSCELAMLDVAYGELEPEQAQQVRSHLSGCDTCRAAYAQIEQGLSLARQLPLAEPPAGLSERLLLEAERQAASHGALVVSPPSLWRRLMDFVGEFASTQQGAMATVMLLIVAVGVWSVPALQRRPEAAGTTVVNVEPAGEAAPSQLLQPADRLELAMDKRGNRIRPLNSELEQGGAAPRARGAPVRTQGKQAHDKDVQEEAVGLLAEATAVAGELAESEPAAGSRQAQGTVGDHEGALDAMGAGAATGADAERFAPPPPQEEQARFASAAKAKKMNGPAAPQAASAPAPASRFASLESDAIADEDDPVAAGSGRHASEAKSAPPSKKEDRGPASQLLWSARGKRTNGGCGAALPVYAELIQRYPRSSEAGHGLLEAAACERKLGRLAAADLLLRRAIKHPSVAVQARRQLDAAPKNAAKAAPAP